MERPANRQREHRRRRRCTLSRWTAARKGRDVNEYTSMQASTAHVHSTSSCLRHPTRLRATSSTKEDCHNSTSVVAPEAAPAPSPGARQFLARAHRLLLSHDRPSPSDYKKLVHAYTLALHQAQSPGRLDVAACFLAHVRLAHLSSGNDGKGYYGGGSSSGGGGGGGGGGNSSSVAHLEAAWKLRDHLPPSPLEGALGFYFRAVGLKLASLYDEQDALRDSSGGRGRRKFDVDVEDGSTDSGNRSKLSLALLRSVANLGAPRVELDREVKDASGHDEEAGAATTTGMNHGGGDRGAGARCDLVCNGCRDTSHSGGDVNAAVPAVAAAAAERRRGRAGGWYCRACTKAYDKAVAQGPINDGTPCAGCEDRTQPVMIEPDGAWYCEACIEEFYEEQEEENEGGRDVNDVVDAGEAGGGVASPAAESETPADKAGSAACGDQTVTLSAEGLAGSTGRDWARSC